MVKLLKKIGQKIVAVIRVAVIVLMLLSLGLSGANAAARLFYNCPIKNLSAEGHPSQKQIIPDATAPEAASEQMAPGSHPYTEQDAYLVSPVFLKVNNDENPLQTRIFTEGQVAYYDLHFGEIASPVSSVSLISSCLGRSLTLVGAKPSGTS